MRDPRAVYNSLLKSPEKLGEDYKNISFSCDVMKKDLTAVKSIMEDARVKDRFAVVRYEDFMKSRVVTIQSLLKFIGASKKSLWYSLRYLGDSLKMTADEREYLKTKKSSKNDDEDVRNISEDVKIDALFRSGVSPFDEVRNTVFPVILDSKFDL